MPTYLYELFIFKECVKIKMTMHDEWEKFVNCDCNTGSHTNYLRDK